MSDLLLIATLLFGVMQGWLLRDACADSDPRWPWTPLDPYTGRFKDKR